MKESKNTKDKTDTHCLRRDSCREPTSIGCHRLSKSIATRSLFLSFSNIFNLVLLYSLFFSQIYKHIHSNAPNFEPKPNCQSFFTSQIEPSHQDNLDTTKNRGRKSRNKGIQRERGGQRLLVVVVEELKGSAMAETRERIRDSRERE